MLRKPAPTMPPAPSQVAIRGSANGRSLPHRCTSTSTPTAAHEKLHRCHAVAKAKPDGYTILLSASAGMGGNRFIYKDLPFDKTPTSASWPRGTHR